MEPGHIEGAVSLARAVRQTGIMRRACGPRKAARQSGGEFFFTFLWINLPNGGILGYSCK